MSSSNIVKLDIGGTVFKTTKATLTKFDGFFKTLFETNVSVEKDESGCIFIDRDPQHFRLVLNFMRDGKVVLPSSKKAIQEILNEAHYYLLQGLVEICGGSFPVQKVKEETVPTVRVVQKIEEARKQRDKTKIFVVITYGNKSPENEIPNSNNALLFVQKHWDRCDIFFGPSKHNPICLIEYKKQAFCGTTSFTTIENFFSWVESKLKKFK